MKPNTQRIGNPLLWLLGAGAVAWLLFGAKKPKDDDGKMTYQKVLYILDKQLGNGYWQVYDEHRWKLERSVMRRVLAKNEIDEGEYNKRHDCNSFAFELKGIMSAPGLSHYCFAFSHSSSHAYNLFIDENGEVVLVEPQNDRLMSADTVADFSGEKGVNGPDRWHCLSPLQKSQIATDIIRRVGKVCPPDADTWEYLTLIQKDAYDHGMPQAAHDMYATTHAYI